MDFPLNVLLDRVVAVPHVLLSELSFQGRLSEAVVSSDPTQVMLLEALCKLRAFVHLLIVEFNCVKDLLERLLRAAIPDRESIVRAHRC